MKRFIITALFLLAARTLLPAQTNDTRFGFKSFEINDPVLGRIDYHVSADGMDREKPVIIYLDGSGAYPLFQYMPQGTGSTVPFSTKEISKIITWCLSASRGSHLQTVLREILLPACLYIRQQRPIQKDFRWTGG